MIETLTNTEPKSDFMDLICRTCLKMNAPYFNIFEYSQNSQLISDLIMDLTSIEISKDDGFPVNICNNCLEKLNSAYNFKQMVIESNKELPQLQQSRVEEICKEETEIVKSEQVEFPLVWNSNNEDPTEDCGYTSIKRENTLEEFDLSNDDDCKMSISSDSVEELPSSLIIQKEPASAKYYRLIKEELKFVQNPDCKRIIESGLSRREKNRATVFCEVCNRTLSFRYYIDRHIHIHTGNLPFKCDQCPLQFAKKYQLRTHTRTHSEEKEYTCEECGKAFIFINQLKMHKLKHTEERPYKCSICEKSFKTAICLQKHKIYHINKKQYVCEECGKCYFNKRALDNHKISHSQDRNWACKTCGKFFPHKDALTRHQRSHLDVRPHCCNTCSKRFTSKRLLNQHTLIHKGLKPYACKICEKTFRQNGCLTRHMRIHTGETPYPCKLCTARFKYLHLLKNHMNRHHKGVVEEEEVKDTAT